jgi:hypothetical protein
MGPLDYNGATKRKVKPPNTIPLEHVRVNLVSSAGDPGRLGNLRRPAREKSPSGGRLGLDRTQEVAGSSPASSIANVPAIRDLLCDATSREVVSCYHRATKPIFEDAFIRNEGVPSSNLGVGFALGLSQRRRSA